MQIVIGVRTFNALSDLIAIIDSAHTITNVNKAMAALLEIRRLEQEINLHQPVFALKVYSLRGDKERFVQNGFDS
jgi:PAS domain-containing protein